ncbi:protein of unknown function [Pseudomonas sp. JV241A]|nr:protein of unknown function [Pseudomonas sp. JV241A]
MLVSAGQEGAHSVKVFYGMTENSFDLQMITIIIAHNWSRDWLDNLKALRSDSQIISSSG